MKTIPTYALYGETDGQQDWLHWETIQSRSRLHDYEIAPHRHEELFQVLLLTKGSATVVLDGAPVDLSENAIVVVPALTVHGYVFSHDVEGIVVTLMERDIAGLGIDLPPAGIVPGSPVLSAALSGLVAEADTPGPAHDYAMRAHLTLLAVELVRAQVRVAPRDEAADRALGHAQAFRHMVDRQFRTTRRIADYASEIGISPTHLNRVSRQVLGASSLEVIERRIALEARRQLLFSNLTIKQIGAELGYDDPAYFSRFLTRVLGVAPGAFRREGRRRAPSRVPSSSA